MARASYIYILHQTEQVYAGSPTNHLLYDAFTVKHELLDRIREDKEQGHNVHLWTVTRLGDGNQRGEATANALDLLSNSGKF